jgi:D-arabinose 1-dehydrogenase-like Zn-dependent alcohol dehydrogenase
MPGHHPCSNKRVRAVVYTSYGAVPVVAEVAPPACPPDGALVSVRATGVCRSDWHGWQGHEPVALPHIPGHEFAGVVAEVGPEVTRWRAGQRVTAPFINGCGRCGYCQAGDAQVCPQQTQPGFTGPGSFAELVAVRAADLNLVELPGPVDFVAAACLGCRFATAYRALTAHGGLGGPDWPDGGWLAVHGCGGVGLSAIQIGVALGARVVAVDVAEEPLALAGDLGAEIMVNAGSEADPVQIIEDVSGGGAAVSIDALGSAATAGNSVRCLRRRGRHLQAGLLHGDAARAIPMDLVVARELEVLGTHGMAARDYPPMLAQVASGVLRPDRLLGQVTGLDGAAGALAAMGRTPARAGMTVIEITPARAAAEPPGR